MKKNERNNFTDKTLRYIGQIHSWIKEPNKIIKIGIEKHHKPKLKIINHKRRARMIHVDDTIGRHKWRTNPDFKRPGTSFVAYKSDLKGNLSENDKQYVKYIEKGNVNEEENSSGGKPTKKLKPHSISEVKFVQANRCFQKLQTLCKACWNSKKRGWKTSASKGKKREQRNRTDQLKEKEGMDTDSKDMRYSICFN